MESKMLPIYKTKDRFEIYTLLSTNCKVDSYESDGNRSVYFCFENKEKCENILFQLISKQLKIYAHEMINAIRDAQAIFNNRLKSF